MGLCLFGEGDVAVAFGNGPLCVYRGDMSGHGIGRNWRELWLGMFGFKGL